MYLKKLFNRATLGVISVLTLCIATAGAQQKAGDNTILSMKRNSIDNTPSSITFSPTAAWKAEQANDIFKQYLGMTDNDLSMKAVSTTTTPAKITTQRFAEYYKGIKVQYGGYTLAIKDGIVHFITGNYYDAATKPSVVPSMSEADALVKALASVGAERYKWQDSIDEVHIKKRFNNPDTSYFPHGHLVFIEDLLSVNKDRKLHLAYAFDIYAQKPLSRQEVFIDAQSGKVLFSNALIQHTAATGKTLYSGVVPFRTAHVDPGTYLLFDSTRGNGIHTLSMNNGEDYSLATEVTSPTNIFPQMVADTTALDAHWGGEMVYDYWLTQQGRHSWDDLDGILIQYVHFSTGYDNAYWDGEEMTYGDGSGSASGGFSSLTSIDVTAHEIGHGVCQATAGLIYEAESGAMNEGFSDCWAATIENWSNPHEVDAMAKHPWDMGEEISIEPLRSMNAPLLQGQPNTYGGTNWYNVVSCFPSGGNDECGVHTNSGLLNYWYYLLVNGGSGTNGIGNAYMVNPLGWTNSAAVLYQTELVLAADATYADCRDASINAATLLFGACSPQVQCVTTAWYAVGIGANYVPCFPQIGFTATSTHVSEAVSSTACPAGKTITVGIKSYGPAILGGAPLVNVFAAATSTAVAGVDYTLGTSTVAFLLGDLTTHNISLTIYDNGNVHDDKHIDLAFTILPLGSTAVVSPVFGTTTIYIDNNDSVPQAGGIQYHTLDAGAPVSSNVSSSFTGSARRAHAQYLLYAAELQAAGVIPGAPMSQIAFNVLTKNSTAPFVNYTISMRNTTVADLSSSFVTGLTQVFTGSHTTNLGIDSVNFNTGTFTWDGTSNVAVEFCFGMNAAPFSGNDIVAGVQQDDFIIGDYNTTNGGSGTGCSLGYNSGNRSTARPVMRFKQTVTAAAIATSTGSSKVWNVMAGNETYFYNPADGKVIAGLKNSTEDLGCVTAAVAQQGIGFTPASFSAINRSVKEISVTPASGTATSTYDITFYMTNAELSGMAAGTLYLLKTDEPTDATISNANSVLVTPALITGTNYVGFRGTFTGFSRYMLVDGLLCNPPTATITPAGPLSFCMGGSVVLNANTGTGLTYRWQQDGIDIPGATSASYIATAAANYAVIVNQSICTTTSSPVTVTVDNPVLSPVTGTASVCTGQFVSLSDATTGGTWHSSNLAVATVSAAGIVSGIAPGVAAISYTITNLCGTITATIAVTVSAPVSVAAISGSPDLCQGSITSLANATPSGIWASAAPATAPVSATGVVSGLASGTATISYSVTNASGCVASATVIVTVHALPSAAITASGATTFCAGGSVVLSAVTGTGLTYQWQVGGGAIGGATASSYTATAAGIYNVLVTSGGICTTTSLPITVVTTTGIILVPSVTFTASPGTVVCPVPAAVTFTATSVNGGSAPAYQWFVNTVPAGTGATYTYTPAVGDLVSCVLTSNAPCAFPDTAEHHVVMTAAPPTLPSVTIAATPGFTVCTGDMVTLAAVPVNGGSAPGYLWNENGINVATGPHYLYVPADGDIIVCTMTSNMACMAATVAVSPTEVMHVVAPTVNTVTLSMSPATVVSGETATFTVVAPNAGTAPVYQWFINGVAVPGATGAIYTTDTLRNGQVVNCNVTSSKVCATPHAATSNGVTAAVTTGVVTIPGFSGAFSLLPNPNKGTFTVNGTIGRYDDKVTIAVTDVLGQVMYSRIAAPHNGTMSEYIVMPAGTVAGMYLVSVTSGDVHEVFHMVIE